MFRDTNDLAYGQTTSLSLFRRAKGMDNFGNIEIVPILVSERDSDCQCQSLTQH